MDKKEHMKKNTREWYLYHHYKNEDALLPVIITSVIALLCNGGIAFSFLIWMWYIYYCVKNNSELNSDPKILNDREFWKNYHIKNGDWEECKQILGI